jgi:hypothetical protein
VGGVRIPPFGQQHVDDLTVLVDRPVHVTPHAIDLDVGLINEPAITWRMPTETGRIRQQWREPLHPPVDGDVIDRDTRSASNSSTSR